jgi:hypothetical protein
VPNFTVQKLVLGLITLGAFVAAPWLTNEFLGGNPLPLAFLFGIGFLEVFLADNDNVFLNLLYLISPHYHLSDLTSRLVFKLGAIEWAELGRIASYLGGLALFTIGLSYQFFREGK